jgi:hypothetical protein
LDVHIAKNQNKPSEKQQILKSVNILAILGSTAPLEKMVPTLLF